MGFEPTISSVTGKRFEPAKLRPPSPRFAGLRSHAAIALATARGQGPQEIREGEEYSIVVGMSRFELELHPPKGRVLPLHHIPTVNFL